MAKKTKNVERVIFSNYYNEESFESARIAMAENLNVPIEDVGDERVWDMYNEDMNIDTEDFMETLEMLNARAARRKTFNNHFVLVGTAQRWNGKFPVSKLVNLDKLLTSLGRDIENVKVYAENKRIYVQASHHDGTHYFELRQKRENVTVETFTNSTYTDNQNVINVTKSTYPLFAEYYGW